MASRMGWSPGPSAWKDDLSPISAADWNYDRAAHLLAHAGFGGTPAEIKALTDAGLERAVSSLVYYESIQNPTLRPFVESGLWDPTLNVFPESRPEATDRALKTGDQNAVKEAQDDIRRALTQVGTGPLFSPRERVAQGQAVEELIKALTYLASRRVGALVILQNEVGLNQYIDVGTRLDAQVSKELVTSIFLPGAPIHDGALIIQRGRITAAGCFLPLTTNPNVSKTLGTRHRAAIGLTEETDAAAIVVSEEDGMISLVREGKITRDVDAATLRTTLHRLLLA